MVMITNVVLINTTASIASVIKIPPSSSVVHDEKPKKFIDLNFKKR